jgi:hypothetical protein
MSLFHSDTFFVRVSRSGAAVTVCKYIFGAFDDIEEANAEGLIFDKESRVAQSRVAQECEAVSTKDEDESELGNLTATSRVINPTGGGEDDDPSSC